MTDTERQTDAHILLTAANGGWRNVARVAVGLGLSIDAVHAAGDDLWDLGHVSASRACTEAAGWMAMAPRAKRAARVFPVVESIGLDTIGSPESIAPLRTFDRSKHDRRPGVVCVCTACLHTGVSRG